MTERFGQDLTGKIFPEISIETIAEQRGGTQYKEDGVIICKNTGDVIKRISYKKKEKTKGGTFDWVNTTSYITEEKKKGSLSIAPLANVIDQAKSVRSSNLVTDKTVEDFRVKVHEATEETLNNFKSEDIRSMIKTLMIDSNKDIHVTVTTLDTGNIYYFPFDQHNMNSLVEDEKVIFSLEKKRKAKYCDSRTIMAEVIDVDTGLPKKIDTGVRIRLHLNNGVSAMLGKSTTNNTSVFCVKFQQDNFQEIIKIAKQFQ
jgi:hypothetical protein